MNDCVTYEARNKQYVEYLGREKYTPFQFGVAGFVSLFG